MRISIVALWYVVALLIPWILVAIFPELTVGLLKTVTYFGRQ
jgi:hypothetical protein